MAASTITPIQKQMIKAIHHFLRTNNAPFDIMRAFTGDRSYYFSVTRKISVL
jgi:hypothetical protein